VQIFLVVWLAGWSAGGFAVLSSLLGHDLGLQWRNNRPPAGFGGWVWMVMWVIGWCAVTYHLLWSLVGFEKIKLQQTILRHEWGFAGLGTGKSYGLSDVKRLRIADALAPRLSGHGSSNKRYASSLMFDYGMGTVQVFKGISPGEAQGLLDKLVSYNRLLAPKSD
jgi:hypothetical protein